MAAEYTGITLTAGQGLLTNQGIRTPPALIDNVDAYQSIAIVNQFRSLVSNAIPVLNAPTLANLQVLGNNNFPALTDAIPANGIANVTTYPTGLSGYVLDRAANLIGNTDGNLDLSKFAQIIFSSSGYISQSTAYISAANNSGLYDPVFAFPGQTALITGNFSDLSDDLSAFAQDLANVGYAVDWNNLINFGNPLTLLQTLRSRNGLLPCVVNACVLAGLSAATVNTISVPGATADTQTTATLYVAFTTLKTDDLAQIQKILSCTTTGFTTVADLLDLAKLFPNSYMSFVVEIGSQTYHVYSDATTLNKDLPFLGNRLNLVVPYVQGQAAIAFGLQANQIKGINALSSTQISVTVQGLETLEDLPLIASFDQFVPESVRSYYNSEFGQGTGPGNTFVAYDLLGTAVGDPETNCYSNINSVMTQISSTATANLSQTYVQMEQALTEPDPNTVFNTVLIPQASTEIQSLVTYAGTTTANVYTIANQLNRENEFLYDADVDFTQLTDTSLNSVLALITNLHYLALDNSGRGYSNLLTALADETILYGQAIIASQREGRNIVELDSTGIQLDAGLDPTPGQ